MYPYGSNGYIAYKPDANGQTLRMRIVPYFTLASIESNS